MTDRPDAVKPCSTFVDLWPTDRPTDPKTVAAAWFEAGVPVIPIRRTTKTPACETWKHLHWRLNDADELRAFFAQRNVDVAPLTGPYAGLAVVDMDTAAGVAWAEAHLPPTPLLQITAKGVHRFYRAPASDDVREGLPWFSQKIGLHSPSDGVRFGDVKASGAYVVAGGARHKTGVIYRTLVRADLVVPGDPAASLRAALAALPVLPIGPFRGLCTCEKTPCSGTEQAHPWAPKPAVRWEPPADPRPVARDVAAQRAAAYVAACGGTPQGARERTAFSLAGALVRGFLLDQPTAIDLLRRWAATCVPPYADERDLADKVRRAGAGKGPQPDGWLLHAERHPNGTPNDRRSARAADDRPAGKTGADRPAPARPPRTDFSRAARTAWMRAEKKDATVLSQRYYRRADRLRACGQALTSEVCARDGAHAPTYLGRLACEAGLCPTCAPRRAQLLAAYLVDEHPEIRALALVTRVRAGLTDDERVAAVAARVRELAKARAKHLPRGTPWRWVRGLDRVVLLVSPEHRADLERVRAAVGMAEIEEKDARGVAALAADLLASCARHLAAVPAERLHRHPLLLQGRVVTTGSSKAGRAWLPWLTSQQLRERAIEAAEARRTTPRGTCGHVGADGCVCGAPTRTIVWSSISGTVLLDELTERLAGRELKRPAWALVNADLYEAAFPRKAEPAPVATPPPLF